MKKYILFLAIVAVVNAKCVRQNLSNGAISVDCSGDIDSYANYTTDGNVFTLDMIFSNGIDGVCTGHVGQKSPCSFSNGVECYGIDVAMGNGNNKNGQCCLSSGDCKDTCVNGICGVAP